MNLLDLPQEDQSSFYALARNRPLSVHLPIGANVYALSGQIWLTQEGLIDDVVLLPGDCFESEQKGLVVMTAMAGPASAYISKAAVAMTQLAASPEFFSAVHAKALRLRQLEMVRLARLLPKLFLRLLTGIKNLSTPSKRSEPP